MNNIYQHVIATAKESDAEREWFDVVVNKFWDVDLGDYVQIKDRNNNELAELRLAIWNVRGTKEVDFNKTRF